MQRRTEHPLAALAGWLKSSRQVAVGLGLTLLLLLPAQLWSQPAPPDVQYAVKAVFLFNFAQFVKWPAQSFTTSTTPITIGILGTDPFGKILDDAVNGEVVGNRKLVVKRISSLAEAKACQILFVSRSESERLAAVLIGLRALPVLTVGEADHFCQRGGIINFFVADNKVKFEANPEAAELGGLVISSKLLKVAKVVKTEKGKAIP